jgi:CheY-like chemotaxis protein
MESPPDRIKKWIPTGTPLFRSAGCPDCAMTGYRGRFSIVEVLTVTPDVERTIAGAEPVDRIAAAAKRAGMKSLWDSGLAHVLLGESSIDELMRVVDVPSEEGRISVGVPAVPDAGAPATPARRSDGHGQKAIVDMGRPSVDQAVLELLEEPPPSRTSGGRPARKVLLVDDEDSLRRVMKDLLEREGYIVSEARDGVQALDQVDRVGPDIIVLDLNLPGLDGYGVLSHLRSRPATSAIPVIVLTAKGDEDNEVRVFELGADDFLSKPFRARALSARLEAVLGRRR